MSVVLVGMHGALCSCPGGRAVRFQELLSCAMPSGLDCSRCFKTLCICCKRAASLHERDEIHTCSEKQAEHKQFQFVQLM